MISLAGMLLLRGSMPDTTDWATHIFSISGKTLTPIPIYYQILTLLKTLQGVFKDEIIKTPFALNCCSKIQGFLVLIDVKYAHV